MHGYGELSLGSNKYYLGYMKSDLRNGFGVYINSSSFKAYVGYWSDGKKQSVGKYMEKTKESKYGIFKNGSLIKWLKSNDKEIVNLLKNQESWQLNLFNLELSDVLKMLPC